MASPITVRIALEGDGDFAYETRALSMRRYVEKTWGEWNEAATRSQISEDILHKRLSIIEVRNEQVGILRIDEFSTHIEIDQLFLLPQHQGKGVGTSLVRDELARAAVKNISVRLWVLRVNPARAFYERLGFSVFEETPASLHLKSAA